MRINHAQKHKRILGSDPLDVFLKDRESMEATVKAKAHTRTDKKT